MILRRKSSFDTRWLQLLVRVACFISYINVRLRNRAKRSVLCHFAATDCTRSSEHQTWWRGKGRRARWPESNFCCTIHATTYTKINKYLYGQSPWNLFSPIQRSVFTLFSIAPYFHSHIYSLRSVCPFDRLFQRSPLCFIREISSPKLESNTSTLCTVWVIRWNFHVNYIIILYTV